jgi:hypothetical protein
MDDPVGSSTLKDSRSSPTKNDAVIRVDHSSTNYGVVRNKESSNNVTKSTSGSGRQGDWIDLGNNFNPLPAGATGFTFSAKVSLTDLSYSGRIFEFYDDDSPNNVIALGSYKHNSITSYVIKEGGGFWLDDSYLSANNSGFDVRAGYYDRTSVAEFTVTMTLAGSGSANNLKLYKDGVLKEQWTVETISAWNFSDCKRAALGSAERASENDGDYIWGGTIRDVRVYDRVLTPGQVMAVHKSSPIR